MSLQGKKLQTKTSRRTGESKEGTLEKVKAIREKQSQWMKEREASKSSATKLKSLNKDHSALPDVPKLRTRSSLSSGSSLENSANRNPYSNPRRKPLYPEPQKDHSDVISWISKGDNPVARKQRPPSASGTHKRNPSPSHVTGSSDNNLKSNKEYMPSNYRNSSSADVPSSTKQTVHNKLRPSSRASVKSDASFHGDDKVDNHLHGDEDSHGNAQVSYTIMSDAASDSRNNSTLINEASLKLNTPELSADVLNALADTVAQRLKATLQPSVKQKQGQQSINEDNESGIASHFCPLCEKMMTGPRHMPMAAIPCGHTYCQTCLRDCKKCPTCQTVVRSTAVNTVMQGIITDFKEQKEKERLQNLEEQTRQYVEEYQSLALRCNALNGEAESILNVMEEVTEQLLDEKKLMKKLEMDETELKQKINNLQKELDTIKVKEEDCQNRCQDLELRYNEEKERLALVEDTVKQIGKSKERVKMMVHNFAPALNLDDYE